MTIKIPRSASLVIPIYNSEKTAVQQIKKCERLLKSACNNYEIILCDDKSTDNTASLLTKSFSKKKNFILILHNKNQGIAKTFFSLYKKAKKNYIILFSVDGDWDPKDIIELLRTAYTKQADIVIGVRKEKNYSRYRKVISFLYNYLPRLLFGVNTFDAGSIKVIRKKTLDNIHIISKSVFFEAEIIMRATKKGYKVIPHPIHFRKRDRYTGKGGKFSLALHAFFDMLKLRFQRI